MLKADKRFTARARWPASAKVCVAGQPGRIATVRIAKSFWTRFVGLLGQRRLGASEGLLFVPGGSIHTLAMRFPIDIVFLDAQCRVLRIAEHVPPWRFVLAPRRTHLVLELSTDTARTPLTVGATLEFE